MRPAGIARIALSLWVAVAFPTYAQTKDDAALNSVLKQMESVGKTFQSFYAQFSQKKYTAVLKEFDVPETGEIYYARDKDGSALLRKEVVSPGPQILTIKGDLATVYRPRLKQAEIYGLGKYKGKDEFLVLGIGQSSGKLRETFDIRYQGTESVAGSPCSILVLKPRNPKTAAFFAVITLWIQKSTGLPIQQKLQEPGGDYQLVNFTGAKLNLKIPASKFEQKLPKDVEIQRFQ